MGSESKKKKKKDYNKMGYLFVAPFVIVFLIFSVYPVFRTLYLSFTNMKISEREAFSIVGFENYLRVLTDKYFWNSLWNTFRIWGVNIVLQLGLAFLLMMVFSDVKYKMKGLPIFRVVYYLPNLIAATSIAFLFSTLLDWRYGTFNQIINSSDILIGIVNGMGKISEVLFGQGFSHPVNWLDNKATAGTMISIIQTWMWFGNSFIMLMAGVQGISKDYFEAAAIDGAGRWTIFRKITLPLIKPILLYVAITSLIGGLQLFDMPFLMIQPTMASYDSAQTAVMYMYKFGFQTGTTQVGFASSIAYVLFAIIAVISVIQLKIFNRKED